LVSDEDVTVTLNVTTIQEYSSDYLYVPINSDFLFTLEENPTVKVTTNGVLGGCRHFNCEYKVDPEVTPVLTSYTYTPEDTVEITLHTPAPEPEEEAEVVVPLADQVFDAINDLR